MSNLSFQVKSKSAALRRSDLPVEVRKADFALVASSHVSKSVPVSPGTYFVSTSLPSGERSFTQVEIPEDKDATAILEINTLDSEEKADGSSSEQAPAAHYLLEEADNFTVADSEVEGITASICVKLRAYAGNLTSNDYRL